MNTDESAYHDLQVHLDRMPIGFPATNSGVEIQILKHLFTPDEARIALELSMLFEPIKKIYHRLAKTGITLDVLKEKLDIMAKKGSIMFAERKGIRKYSNALPVIGMYEFQVDSLTKDFVSNFEEYAEEQFFDELYRTGIGQLRTIPIEKAVIPEHPIATFDDIKALALKAPKPIAVANCICRQEQDILEHSCTKTDIRESCLIFGDSAKIYLNKGNAREITTEAMLELLQAAENSGLIFQPGNSKNPANICMCCGDCCGILRAIKRYPKPAELVTSSYSAIVNKEKCTGCKVCENRCHMDAVIVSNRIASVNNDRCIGCGLCTSTCKMRAITLQLKTKAKAPPKDSMALYRIIWAKRIGFKKMLGIVGRIITGKKV